MYVLKNEKKNKDYCINKDNKDEEEKEEDIMNYDWDSKQIKTLYYNNITLFLLLNSDEI